MTTIDEIETPAQTKLVMTRVFDAPRATVFRAWTDAGQLARWWGPKGFTNPVCEIDPRVGGGIKIDMKGPHGVVYPMTAVIDEIVEPERLVMTCFAHLDNSGIPEFEIQNTAIFEELDGKTKLTIIAKLVRSKGTPAAASALDGQEQGWSESLDRLSDLSTGLMDRQISAIRFYEAPRELVFNAWTDPERVAKWFGPNGFSLTTHKMDVRPGGQWLFTMHGPDGADYKNDVTYVTVDAPELLVYEHAQPPFRMTITFEQFEKWTRLTVTQTYETSVLRNKVADQYGAIEGLSQTLNRLADNIAAG